MEEIIEEFLFWGVWLIIPLLIDIIYGVIAALSTLFDYLKNRKITRDLDFYPKVTIIIPVYNSSKTLKGCIESITNQNYPLKEIQIFLIDNGSIDNSHELFYELQEDNPKLKMWYLDSSKGKAKALNKGLYMSDGKYIINIDSDGILHEDAIYNMVYKFENNHDICAMTGVVLTNIEDIKRTKGFAKRVMQRCELFEYVEAFLIGRAFQSKTNTMFTMAGACSAFRKDVVLKTQLYNAETLGEDTHMTSQIREFLSGKVVLCEDAFFIVDPIESMDKIYIQRQRWQRGGIEVSTLFNNTKKKKLNSVLKLAMIQDHTLVFPRMIWMFAMIYLVFIEYPIKLVIGANIILYIAYVLLSTVYYFVSRLYLKKEKNIRKYMRKHILILFVLPLYRMIVFFFRVAGILNAYEKKASWNTRSFSEESAILKETVKKKMNFYFKLKKWINSSR